MAMTLRLTDEQDVALAALARSQGISKNEAALRAIIDAAARHDRAAAIKASVDDVTTRYAATLQRLGE